MIGSIPFREVDLRLQSCQMIWLTTTSSEGDRHCVPISFWWESATRSLYFLSSPRAAKARHLTRNPQVILNTGEGSDTIILEGTAQPVSGDAEYQRVSGAWQGKYEAPCAASGRLTCESVQLYRVQIAQVVVREYDRGNTRTCESFEGFPVGV